MEFAGETQRTRILITIILHANVLYKASYFAELVIGTNRVQVLRTTFQIPRRIHEDQTATKTTLIKLNM